MSLAYIYSSKHEINDCSLQTIRAFRSNKCLPIRMVKSVRYFRFCFQYTCNWKIKSIVSMWMWMALVEVKTTGVHKSNPAFSRIDMNTNVWCMRVICESMSVLRDLCPKATDRRSPVSGNGRNLSNIYLFYIISTLSSGKMKESCRE